MKMTYQPKSGIVPWSMASANACRRHPAVMSSNGAGSKEENSFQLEDRITVVFLLFA